MTEFPIGSKTPGAAEVQGISPLTRLLIEAGPLAVFFVSNSQFGIMAGTAAFMAATMAAVTASWHLERKLPIMPMVGCGFVMLFGGLTLALDNELFIKLKPTVVNLLFATILFTGLGVKRNLLKPLLGSVMSLSDAGWRALSFRWACFFVVLAVLNEIVWRTMSTDAWVNFKVFAILPLTIVFSGLQVPLILRHQVEPDGSTGKEA